MSVTPFKIGDVLELPVGLRTRLNQSGEVQTINAAVQVVVESVWPVLAGVGGTNHFEDGYMVAARALNADGSYFPEGALLTFAQSGDFRPEFILPGTASTVLRRMSRSFTPIPS